MFDVPPKNQRSSLTQADLNNNNDLSLSSGRGEQNDNIQMEDQSLSKEKEEKMTKNKKSVYHTDQADMMIQMSNYREKFRMQQEKIDSERNTSINHNTDRVVQTSLQKHLLPIEEKIGGKKGHQS